LKYNCKLCNSESTVKSQGSSSWHKQYDVCELCISDIFDWLNTHHHFNDTELHLKINLRRLRSNLQKISNIDNTVSSVLNSVQVEIDKIEKELGGLASEYPNISKVISEYRSLLRVYN